MNKIPSPATKSRGFGSSVLQRGYVPQPKTPKSNRTNPAKANGRQVFLQRGTSATSPDLSGPRSNAAVAKQGPTEFTSKLFSNQIVDPTTRCGPPGPAGRNGFDPETTALPFIILQADDGTLHRLFIRKSPGSDPASYTTMVEQAPYLL